MKISVIPTGDKVTRTANTTVVYCLGNAKFQSEFIENKDVFFPHSSSRIPEIYGGGGGCPWTSG
jgi:hypothetical protein